MLYPYVCASGHADTQRRAAAARDQVQACPCGLPLERDVATQLRSITINPVPMNFFTQWSDVYPNISQKEMARKAGVERYDPTLRHKPEVTPVNLHKHLPRGVTDVDQLVRAIAPVDGKRETDKMLEQTAPLQGERTYS